MGSTTPVRLPNPKGAHETLERIVAWSPDGSRLLLDDASSRGPCLVDVESWEVQKQVEPFGWVRFDTEGRRLAFVPQRPPFRVCILDLHANTERTIPLELPSADLSFSVDGTRLVFADDYTIHIYRLEDEPVCETQLPSPGEGEQLHHFALHGSDLAAHSTEMAQLTDFIHVWDLQAASPQPRTLALEPSRLGGHLLPDGSAIIRWGEIDGSNRLRVQRLPDGQIQHDVALPAQGRTNSFTATPDASTVVVQMGPANGAQQLYVLRDVLTSPSTARMVAELGWRSSFVAVHPQGRSVLFHGDGALQRVELPPRFTLVQ